MSDRADATRRRRFWRAGFAWAAAAGLLLQVLLPASFALAAGGADAGFALCSTASGRDRPGKAAPALHHCPLCTVAATVILASPAASLAARSVGSRPPLAAAGSAAPRQSLRHDWAQPRGPPETV